MKEPLPADQRNDVLEKWRDQFAQPSNSDHWWTRLRAMDMFLELQGEIYRLRAEDEQWDKHSLVQIVEERDRLRAALQHIAAFPKMRQATRITSIMQYAREALDVTSTQQEKS